MTVLQTDVRDIIELRVRYCRDRLWASGKIVHTYSSTLLG